MIIRLHLCECGSLFVFSLYVCCFCMHFDCILYCTTCYFPCNSFLIYIIVDVKHCNLCLEKGSTVEVLLTDLLFVWVNFTFAEAIFQHHIVTWTQVGCLSIFYSTGSDSLDTCVSVCVDKPGGPIKHLSSYIINNHFAHCAFLPANQHTLNWLCLPLSGYLIG